MTKKILRYILYKIESQLNGGADYDFESDKGTIEHILPESYSEPYKVLFSEEEFHKNIFLLGNMTLLEAQKKIRKKHQIRLFLKNWQYIKLVSIR